MGVDYSAKLVFGVRFGYETFVKIVKTFMEEDEKEEDYVDFYYGMLDECTDERFTKKYPGLRLGIAYPYPHSDSDQWVFYIGIGRDNEELSLAETLRLVNSWEDTPFLQCLKDFDFDEQEPSLLALPHIS